MPEANAEVRSTEDDPALLLVAGMRGKDRDKEYVKKLAHAIVKVFNKYGMARMRCVGAASVNNADKAYIIAKGELLKQGVRVALDQSFTDVEFDGVEKTGILKQVWKVEDVPTGEA